MTTTAPGPDGWFDEAAAAHYDEYSADMFDPAVVGPAVEFLGDAARGGRALELGIGTGRIALPLSARGVEVHGVDLSRPMVARLRAKAGGEAIPVTIGDFASVRVAGTFRLVYLVFNTIMNLTEQEAQVDAFRNAAAHLDPGGRFVVEVMVPALRRLPPGERYHVFDLSAGHWGVDEYDVATQRLISHHVELSGGRGDVYSGPFRYVWPSELDLMAGIAGLRLVERWGSWTREPFTSESEGHVSVWEKPAVVGGA